MLGKLAFFFRRDLVLSAILALLGFVCALGMIGMADYSTDELTFMLNGLEPQLGYVDGMYVPSLSAGLSHAMFGYTSTSVRLLPLLSQMAAVFCVGLLARAFGGRWLAQGLASLAMLTAPVTLGACMHLAIASFEPLAYTLFCLSTVEVLKNGKPSGWLLVGLAAGYGLAVCQLTLLWMTAFLIGLCLTKQRRHLGTIWPYIGAAAALVPAIPGLIWLEQHEWCACEYYFYRVSGHYTIVSYAQFWLGQVVFEGLANVPLILVGTGALLFCRPLANYRCLVAMFLVLLQVYLIVNSDVYYLSPGFPVLFAAGGWALEAWSNKYSKARSLVAAYALVVAGAGILVWSVLLGFVPVEHDNDYVRLVSLGLVGDSGSEIGQRIVSVKHRYYWELRSAQVGRMCRKLEALTGESATVITGRDDVYCALRLFGGRYGVKKVVSPVLNHYYRATDLGAPPSLLLVEATDSTIQLLDSIYATKVTYDSGDEQSGIRLDWYRHPKVALCQVWSQLRVMTNL